MFVRHGAVITKNRDIYMRIRTILLVSALLILAGFVALNVDEFTRISPLNLGFTTLQVSLGLVMLALLVASLLIFLGSTLYLQSRHVLEARTHTRELTAQRDLADKAEASRFTELRGYLEEQVRAEQQRETALGVVLADRFSQQQQVLLARMEQIDKSLAGHIDQLEDRLTRKYGTAPTTGFSLHNSDTTLR